MKKVLVGAAFLFATFSQAITPTLSKQRVVFRTDFGDLVFVLYPTVAPQTVEQFLKLVRLGIYDSMHFYRAHPGFVLQVSDANGREWPMTPQQKQAIRKIPAEFSSLSHQYGALTMAHYDGQPDSGEVSFSIMLGPGPHLDGKYTVFGEMEQGHETLDRLLAQPRTDTTPIERLTIRSAQVADSPEILKSILAQKTDRPRQIASVTATAKPKPILVWGLAAIAFIAGVVALLGRRFPTRASNGLHWIILLIAVFSLTVALGPLVMESPLVGAALCVALLTTFRLFSRFETH